MSRCVWKLCPQDVLASAARVPRRRRSPARPIRLGVAGHFQPTRHVAGPAGRDRCAAPAEETQAAGQRATDRQGAARLRRAVAGLLSVDRRPALRQAGSARASAGQGRLRHDVLRTRLQRVSTYDVGAMSVSVRLVLSCRLRRLST